MAQPTRRDWLKTVAAASIAGLSGPGAGATRADEKPALPLGFSLYGMRSLKTADALQACARIGYDGVELALLPGWPTDPKRLSADDRRELRKRLVDSNLALLGLMENLSEPAAETVHRANLDRLRAAADLGHALSPKAPPVIETVLGGKPANWDKVKEKLAERLRAWAEVGKTTRTVIAVKPHVGNALHTPEGALWLLGQIKSPWLRLAFDYSHLGLRGIPMAKAIAALVPHSVFIHVKDARGSADKFEFLLPGEGKTDYREYFRLVRAAGYTGPVVVEVSSQISRKPGYDPLAAARRCHATLAAALGQKKSRE
jgi:sugar phosphate isomerase/epimerase